jgi:hypothetical protein
MAENEKFLRDFLAKAAQPVQWSLKFQGRLDHCRQWEDDGFQEITRGHGFAPDDVVTISHGVANPGSLACQDLWKLESEKKSMILTATEPKTREFGGVM